MSRGTGRGINTEGLGGGFGEQGRGGGSTHTRVVAAGASSLLGLDADKMEDAETQVREQRHRQGRLSPRVAEADLESEVEGGERLHTRRRRRCFIAARFGGRCKEQGPSDYKLNFCF